MKKIYYFIVGISFIGLSIISYKVKNKKGIITTQLTNYTTADGLINNAVNTIVVDKNANLWIGTATGVSEFDGQNWINYDDVTHSYYTNVTSIAIDSLGNKWFGTYGGGIAKFDGQKWMFYYTEAYNTNSLISNFIRSIAVDINGDIWIGTRDGVSKFDRKNWTNYTSRETLIGDDIYSIAIDRQGNKWIGTNQGISKFDGKKWINYSSNVNKSINATWDIEIDKQGIIWFATSDGILKYDGKNWANYLTKNYWLRIKIPVKSIAIDNQGNKWIGSIEQGVSVFDSNWKKLGNADCYNLKTLEEIIIDKQGNKWIATHTGLLKLQNDKTICEYANYFKNTNYIDSHNIIAFSLTKD